MTELLYLDDSYCKEAEAHVVEVNGVFVVLDRSIFYPEGGGQASDTGTISCNGQNYAVVYAKKMSSNVSLQVENEGLKAGDTVHCTIEWSRRYKLMRAHTAAHLLSAVFSQEAGAKITGNQLGVEKSRIDFSLDSFDKSLVLQYVAKANEIIRQNLPVTVSSMSREEVLCDPSLVKLAGAIPPTLPTLRIVSIGEYDRQADGGTHVRSLSEVGRIELLSVENKGAQNRRVYFDVR